MKLSKSQLFTIEKESLEFLNKYPFGKVRVPLEIAQKWLLENKYIKTFEKGQEATCFFDIRDIGLGIFEVKKSTNYYTETLVVK